MLWLEELNFSHRLITGRWWIRSCQVEGRHGVGIWKQWSKQDHHTYKQGRWIVWQNYYLHFEWRKLCCSAVGNSPSGASSHPANLWHCQRHNVTSEEVTCLAVTCHLLMWHNFVTCHLLMWLKVILHCHLCRPSPRLVALLSPDPFLSRFISWGNIFCPSKVCWEAWMSDTLSR